jgi:hypothetical protein
MTRRHARSALDVLRRVDNPPWKRQRGLPNSTLTKQASLARVFAPHSGRSLRRDRRAGRSNVAAGDAVIYKSLIPHDARAYPILALVRMQGKTPMPTSDEYRKIAEGYDRLARKAKTETDRLALLDLARTWLEAVSRQDEMTPAKIADAQKFAHEWKPKLDPKSNPKR